MNTRRVELWTWPRGAGRKESKAVRLRFCFGALTLAKAAVAPD